MQPDQPKSRRLSLTKKQLEEESGASLLALLNEIVADGKISEDEVLRLHAWTQAHAESDLPAIGFLKEVIDGAIADGSVSDADRLDLHLAIERILPVTARSLSKEARIQAEPRPELPPKISREDLLKMKADPSDDSTLQPPKTWRDDPMTAPQRAFIKSLRGSISPSATKGEASELIGTLLGNKPLSPRQQMVMRFWGRERLSGEGPSEIADWMDAFYSEDPDRKLAWELFKQEVEDDGLQGDPARVTFGIGPAFLTRIKQGGEAAIPRFGAKQPNSAHYSMSSNEASNGSIWFALIMCAVVACGVAYFVSTRATHNPASSTKNPVSK